MDNPAIPPPPTPEQAAAMAAAANQLYVEIWTLFAVSALVTMLRTYVRIEKVGLRRLQPDDYLVWLALIFYGLLTGLAYSVGRVAHGMANNGMTDAHRAALPIESAEYRLRVIGSVIQLSGWSVYSVLLWSLKASWLVFYLRLTEGLAGGYRMRIHIGFALIVATWMIVLLNLFLSCRPFNHYWQINPNPGNVCQPAVSNPIIWVYYVCNITTDLYLLSIPLPLLWGSQLQTWKKISLISVFSGGIFIVVCATFRVVFIVTDPVNGAQLAGSWAARECFVAVVTTNLPMVFTLVKAWVGPVVSLVSTKRSSHKDTNGTPRMTPTFGGGRSSRRGRGPPSANPIPDMTKSESEEHIVYEMKHMDERTEENAGKIHKTVWVDVVREERPEPQSPGKDRGGNRGVSDRPWEQVQSGHSTHFQGRGMSFDNGPPRY